MDVDHEVYNVISLCRHETLLLDMFLVYLSLLLDWVLKYLYIYHNNVTDISSEVAQDVKKDRATLFP